MELSESGAVFQDGRMLLVAFTRLVCGCPVRAALLLLWDTVGLLAVNNHSKTHVIYYRLKVVQYGVI